MSVKQFNFLNDIVHYITEKVQYLFGKHKRRYKILCESLKGENHAVYYNVHIQIYFDIIF